MLYGESSSADETKIVTKLKLCLRFSKLFPTGKQNTSLAGSCSSRYADIVRYVISGTGMITVIRGYCQLRQDWGIFRGKDCNSRMPALTRCCIQFWKRCKTISFKSPPIHKRSLSPGSTGCTHFAFSLTCRYKNPGVFRSHCQNIYCNRIKSSVFYVFLNGFIKCNTHFPSIKGHE